MTEEGIPVVCETDIHGAVTAVMVQAAGMGKLPLFLRTGLSAILKTTTVSSFSTADPGRFLWQKKSLPLKRPLLLIIPIPGLSALN